MKWIVLSDLHMNFKNCTTKIARQKLVEAIKAENKKGKVSFILITGDCLHQYKGDIEEIKNFILKISKACNLKSEKVILCPGNHDIDRKNVERNEAIRRYRENGNLPDLDVCLEGYGKFKELYSLFYGSIYRPFRTKNIGEFKIITLDSCLLSMDDKDYGHLTVNFPQLADLKDELEKDKKINVVIMHHGVEWLQPEEGRRFQHWLADNDIRMVFCGHNHAPGMNILSEAIDSVGVPRDGVPQFTCGCALADSYSNPVFLVGEYKKEEFMEMKLYEYRDNSRWEITSITSFK